MPCSQCVRWCRRRGGAVPSPETPILHLRVIVGLCRSQSYERLLLENPPSAFGRTDGHLAVFGLGIHVCRSSHKIRAAEPTVPCSRAAVALEAVSNTK